MPVPGVFVFPTVPYWAEARRHNDLHAIMIMRTSDGLNRTSLFCFFPPSLWCFLEWLNFGDSVGLLTNQKENYYFFASACLGERAFIALFITFPRSGINNILLIDTGLYE